MYQWMVDPSADLTTDLPRVEDIPQTGATIDLIDLITKVSRVHVIVIKGVQKINNGILCLITWVRCVECP